MSAILHHLAALGWGWVALFVGLDLVTIACAVLAVAGRERRLALWALMLSGGATLASVAMAAVVAAAGVTSASAALVGASADPSAEARELADGISASMNGAALGLLSALVAGIATAVCLVAAVVYRPKSSGLTASNHPDAV